jgi:hypothetical protein
MEKQSVLDQNPESERVFGPDSALVNEGPQAENPTKGLTAEPTEKITPIFDQIEGMDQNGAVNVLIQAAQMAQSSGALTVRDSVMIAKAVSVLQPGSI